MGDSLQVPVLETERLRLRGHRLDDFAACAAMWANPIVTRHFGQTLSGEESWNRVLRYVGHWALLGFGY
jgi:RimJ/RimL family protein N-acetyltransferase